MQKEDLKEYAELAYKILNDGKQNEYISNKDIISDLFKNQTTNQKTDFFVVKNRLTIIDSYYSTQMNRRLYGIDDLAKEISKHSDEKLKAEAKEFLEKPNENNEIKKLFSEKYGINKSGIVVGKATSLISKYIYFLTGYNFPIYDSLAIESYKLFQKNNLIEKKPAINEGNYFELIKELKSVTKIENYDKLDNLLWLLGKLSKGSFSLLMKKQDYQNLIKNVSFDKNDKSEEKDDKIRQYIEKSEILKGLFSDEQKEFFKFVFDLLE